MSDARRVGVARTAVTLASLKWHVLLGGLRGSTQQRIQTLFAAAASTVVGVLALLVLWAFGRGAELADDLLVVLLPAVVLGVGLLSAAAGVESSVDPRHLAGEPIGRWGLGVGMLATAVVGPPTLLAVLAGSGILIGWWVAGPAGGVVVVAAVGAWWLTLLLFSRTLANTLGAVATTRFKQAAQAGATIAALFAWLATQLAARNPADWDADRWASLASVTRWTPPGQLAIAIVRADDPAAAVGHLALGVLWLPLLVWTSVYSTQRLALSSPRPGGGRSAGHRLTRRHANAGRRVIPEGRVGAVASRTVRTKFRTPRQAVNTVTALAIGAGVFFLGPILGGDHTDARIVMVGGLLHFAVLFDGNNAFGMDGPAIWMEVAAGADGRVLVRGKVISSLVVMWLPAVVLPLGLAVITGGWQWLVAGWLVAAGSVLAAAGVAVSSAALAPVALPDSPNPLAAGDTGQGCVAGLMLMACMVVLLVVSAPVAALVLWASSRSAPGATAAALLAPAVGALTLWGGIWLASVRLQNFEAELVQKVTPAR